MNNKATFPAFKLIFLALALLAPPAAFSSSHDFQSYFGIDASYNRVRVLGEGWETGLRTFMGVKGGNDLPINFELFWFVSSHDAYSSSHAIILDPITGNFITTRSNISYSTVYSNYGPMLKYRLEIIDNLSLTPGVGLGFFNLETTGFNGTTPVSSEAKDIGLMFHMGAEYAFNDTFSIRVGYDYLDAATDDVTGPKLYDDDIHHGTAGVVLSF